MKTAVEIGTHMGVSAAVIAGALASDGLLYCVDPWPRRLLLENPSMSICMRELKRKGLRDKVRVVRRRSAEAASELPARADFIFVDGDHSREGLAGDWKLVGEKLAPGGIVCLHDTTVPDPESDLHLGAPEYFRESILTDGRFELLETVYSMNVLRRRDVPA
jgi:predicted O-methyltransferase YrrM